MLHLQAINPKQTCPAGWPQSSPASYLTPAEGFSPATLRGTISSMELVRSSTPCSSSARKVLELNVFILFVLWNKKHYLQDLVNYTCVDLDTLPLVLRQGDHHPEHHPINHVVSKLNIKACTIKTFWRPICRVNHSFMTPQNYSQSYQVCILKINKTVKNQPLKPLCSALLKKYQDICPPA